MVEERHTDQLDWNLVANFSHIFRNNSKIYGGLSLRRNRTEYYSEVKDLLGGDYWADIDKFAERDFGSNAIAYQNNLDYYYRHGHAHAAKVGDKYGYDYYAHVLRTKAWAAYNFNVGGLGVTVGGEVGYASQWREGLWRKGLFPDNSKGDSKKLDYLTYKAKGNFSYRFSAAHTVEANVVYLQDAPEFQASFVSPRTRNTTTPGLSAERVFGVDASYNLRVGDLKARVSGYYTRIYDQSKVISYYDDVAATFTNFAMSGIDKLHFGLEAAVSIPLYRSLALNGAVSWGQYTYDSNPYYLQTQDNSGDIVSDGYVYWKNFRVESTPQLAANVGLSYRSNNNIFLVGRLQLLQQHVSVDEPDLSHRCGDYHRHDGRGHRSPAPSGEVRLGLYAQRQHRQELVYPPPVYAGLQPRSQEYPEQSGHPHRRLRADPSDEEHRDDGDYLSSLRLEVFLHVRYDLLSQSLLPFLTANE